MDDEYTTLIENNIWNLVPLPKNANIIRTEWIFKIKKNLDDSINRYKARLVA